LKRVDPFVLALFAAVGLGWLLPELGANDGPLHPPLLAKLGVGVIYFGQGLNLTTEELRHAGKALRVHALVQSVTFVLLPLLGWLLVYFGGALLGPELSLGIAFLCALPSTVSSAITLTAIARGNVSVAMINATLSSLLGIVVTPLLMRLSTHTAAEGPSFTKVVADLALSLALPFVLGQLLQPRLGGWARRHKRALQNLDRSIILLLIYTSFAESFHARIWESQGSGPLLLTVGSSAALFFVCLYCIGALCSIFALDRATRTAATFAAVTKSLATGVGMAHIVFGETLRLGPILLPLLVYHPLQLLVCSTLASRWARTTASVERITTQ
jgi:solute carrier family 10 (sodium/bile acid cotransporter), member 7